MNQTLILFIIVGWIGQIQAQISLKETLNRSEQGSFITLEKINPNIDDDLVFEFGLQHNFLIHYDNFLPKFWFAFRPEINFRMRDSFIVVNPAYRFNLSLYYDWSKESQQRLFFIGYDHHSNGKNGTFFVRNTDQINLQNGDFATDFFKIGYLSNQKWRKKEHWNLLQRYSFRFDPGIIRTRQRTFLYELYNRYRVGGFWQLTGNIGQSKNRFSVDFELEFLLQNINQESFEDRIIADLRLNFQPSFLHPTNVWLFLQAYSGEDYYQIYFFRQLRFFRMGLTMRVW